MTNYSLFSMDTTNANANTVQRFHTSTNISLSRQQPAFNKLRRRNTRLTPSTFGESNQTQQEPLIFPPSAEANSAQPSNILRNPEVSSRLKSFLS
jgi:hypothetical protein